MEPKQHEEIYEILDEMNARIEDIIDEFNDPDTLEVIASKLQQKAYDFVYELQQEIEKLELLELEM